MVVLCGREACSKAGGVSKKIGVDPFLRLSRFFDSMKSVVIC